MSSHSFGSHFRVKRKRPIAKRNALKRRLGSMNGLALLAIALLGLIFRGPCGRLAQSIRLVLRHASGNLLGRNAEWR